MICYPRFAISAGNLGNQCMQYMSLIGFAKKYNCELQLPKWKYANYFENSVTMYEPVDQPKCDLHVEEGPYHYTPEWFDQYKKDFQQKNVSIFGWLQTKRYWDHAIDEVRYYFTFKEAFCREVLAMLPEEACSRPAIAVSIRQGDYRGNPNYKLLPVRYYIMALMEHFPDFRENYNLNYNLIFLSDDIEYCRLHFGCLKNAYFAEKMTDIQQLCLMSQMDNMILPNSTFAIAAAHIAELHGSVGKIIYPSQYFDGELAKTHDTRDLWEPNWHRFDIDQRINLLNATFTIPVSYDSKDRKENFDLNLKLLMQDFDTNIIVGEQGSFRFNKCFEDIKLPMGKYSYRHFSDMKEFHRTKMLNDMAIEAKSPVVINWDADVVVPPMQIIEGYRALQDDFADMVYPYDGRFARVSRDIWYRRIMSLSDIGVLAGTYFQGMGSGDYSVGGAVMWDAQAFVEAGMENEYMISYAPEDAERVHRAKKLGFRVKRIGGVLYHIDHVRGINSQTGHALYKENAREFSKIEKMSVEALREYVNTWPWKREYAPAYHEGIAEEAIRSRDEVFKVLFEWGILHKDARTTRILDVGCGLGAWGKDIPKEYSVIYHGIDYKVPETELLIPVENYIDFDLRIPMIAWEEKESDLILCLEVLEHLEEKYADTVIESLCNSADTILFSAAIPGQGGTCHVNEQWQSYWAKKFAERGYYPYYQDIRQKLWNNENVSVWYRQNMVLYCREYAERHAPRDINDDYPLDVVHPQMYENILRSKKILKK